MKIDEINENENRWYKIDENENKWLWKKNKVWMSEFWNLEQVLRSLIKQNIFISQDGRPRPPQSDNHDLEKR